MYFYLTPYAFIILFKKEYVIGITINNKPPQFFSDRIVFYDYCVFYFFKLILYKGRSDLAAYNIFWARVCSLYIESTSEWIL